ncbi:MAG: hypothetical protein J5589_02810, partial [Firmicutes bacterium]|nr:hypothetical protein [Bacillota bacterium]
LPGFFCICTVTAAKVFVVSSHNMIGQSLNRFNQRKIILPEKKKKNKGAKRQSKHRTITKAHCYPKQKTKNCEP